MPVKTDASGRRWVELTVEVPGTPEDVWSAIATGPGISSWFVPTQVDEREGGKVVFGLGGGVESTGTVTGWQPPMRFAYEEPDWSAGAPPLATEFIVEARSGGTCVLRLVHSLFASSDDWDEQFTGFETGWPPFFEVLRLYLTHFHGQPCAPFRVTGNVPDPQPQVWDKMVGLLGLAGVRKGDHRRAPDGAPMLAGIVEAIDHGVHDEVTLRLEEPGPGIALIGAAAWGGMTHPAISHYWFGEQAAAIAAREEPVWHAWMNRNFPSAPDEGDKAAP